MGAIIRHKYIFITRRVRLLVVILYKLLHEVTLYQGVVGIDQSYHKTTHKQDDEDINVEFSFLLYPIVGKRIRTCW